MIEFTCNSPCSAQLTGAVWQLQRGGIVAFPTETFYGLAVNPFCRSALVALFELKKRAADKPIIVLIDQLEQLSLLARSVPKQYLPLMERHWPGPLTLIFPAKKTLPFELTGGTETIGIRISSHPLARKLVRTTGLPLTATSANISGYPPPQTAQGVAAMFGPSLCYILDGGKTAGGLSSTVVGLAGDIPVVLRQGPIHIDL
jgi:L-threonylcarbamoyladenylate synthase